MWPAQIGQHRATAGDRPDRSGDRPNTYPPCGVRGDNPRRGAKTLGWELALIHSRGLDKAAGLDLTIVDLATTDAGKIAIAGGSVDVILSDWLWVSRERGLGQKLVFYPYSSAVGSLMVPAEGSIDALAELKGKRLGVAGGPLDKSWLLLQAFAKQSGVALASDAKVAYGAPPLLAAEAARGDLDATLQFWNYCADLEQRGFRSVLDIRDVEIALGASAPVAMVGFVFDEDYAATHAPALAALFAVSRQAKEILAAEAGEWPAIMTRIGQPATAAEVYHKRYAAGVPRRPPAAEESDAERLYKVIATTGGPDLVGDAATLDPGTYYKPARD